MRTIELDCAPMTPRPDTYLPGVLEGTGLSPKPPIDMFFGCWTWEFDISDEEWTSKVVPIIKPRIEALYHNHFIRYGSW